MNSRALRRLAGDHSSLHNQPLPPNYLFPPNTTTSDDLAQLDVLLAGPTHTPFARGVFKLHLAIPSTYPQSPPTANFRTSIFHPNVDPQTGGICVETLKRDWDSNLTLRDVLVTISCLLIQPNPDSALNADAGALIQEDYAAFAKRAELMTSMQAGIPMNLLDAVREAQNRGQESEIVVREDEVDSTSAEDITTAPVRRRRPTVRQRCTAASRSSDGSPSAAPVRRRRHYTASNPFIAQPPDDEPFGRLAVPENSAEKSIDDDDSNMIDENQENDETRSPTKVNPPKVATPRRPLGAPVPLGELTLEDVGSSEDDNESEQEYPPSPRKSPTKSAMKRPAQHSNTSEESDRPESGRAAVTRARDITPLNNFVVKPLAHNSPFMDSSFTQVQTTSSPKKNKGGLFTPGEARAPLFGSLDTPRRDGGIFKKKSPSSSERKREEEKRREELGAKLWDACGRDVRRWNRGDFDGEPFIMKAKRW